MPTQKDVVNGYFVCRKPTGKEVGLTAPELVFNV